MPKGKQYHRYDLQKLRSTLRPLLERWLSQHVQDFQAGISFKCVLPSHKDQTASMRYNGKDKGSNSFTVHCYGCGWHGDIFDLFKELYGLSNVYEAAAAIAQWAGIPLKACEIDPPRSGAPRRSARAALAASELEAEEESQLFFQTFDPIAHLDTQYEVYRKIEEAETADAARIEQFLSELNFKHPVELMQCFTLGLTPEPLKYASLLICDLDRWYTSVTQTGRIESHGLCPMLFNIESLAEACSTQKRLWIVDGVLDVLALQDRGMLATALLNPRGCDLLYREILKQGRAPMLILWMADQDLQHALCTGLKREGIDSFVCYSKIEKQAEYVNAFAFHLYEHSLELWEGKPITRDENGNNNQKENSR